MSVIFTCDLSLLLSITYHGPLHRRTGLEWSVHLLTCKSDSFLIMFNYYLMLEAGMAVCIYFW